MSQSQAAATSVTQKSKPAPTIAAQQGDNIAHALAGAGGGILSMILTCDSPNSPLLSLTHHS